MAKARRELKNVSVEELSLVDTPAVPKAKFVIAKKQKAAPEPSEDDDEVETEKADDMKPCPKCKAMNPADAELCKECKAKMAVEEEEEDTDKKVGKAGRKISTANHEKIKAAYGAAKEAMSGLEGLLRDNGLLEEEEEETEEKSNEERTRDPVLPGASAPSVGKSVEVEKDLLAEAGKILIQRQREQEESKSVAQLTDLMKSISGLGEQLKSLSGQLQDSAAEQAQLKSELRRATGKVA